MPVVVVGDVKLFLSSLEDVRAHLRHSTRQDQPGLCKMSAVEVTELTIDLKLHKHGRMAEYLPPINLRLNHAPLSASIINHQATESTCSRLNSTSLLISFNTFK